MSTHRTAVVEVTATTISLPLGSTFLGVEPHPSNSPALYLVHFADSGSATAHTYQLLALGEGVAIPAGLATVGVVNGYLIVGAS